MATTLILSNFNNPFPYQKDDYNRDMDIEFNFYQDFFLHTRQMKDQPLFSYYQRSPSIIYVNQNDPTNTLDNYPRNNKISPGGLAMVTLSIAFDETTAEIIKR